MRSGNTFRPGPIPTCPQVAGLAYRRDAAVSPPARQRLDDLVRDHLVAAWTPGPGAAGLTVGDVARAAQACWAQVLAAPEVAAGGTAVPFWEGGDTLARRFRAAARLLSQPLRVARRGAPLAEPPEVAAALGDEPFRLARVRDQLATALFTWRVISGAPPRPPESAGPPAAVVLGEALARGPQGWAQPANAALVGAAATPLQQTASWAVYAPPAAARAFALRALWNLVLGVAWTESVPLAALLLLLGRPAARARAQAAADAAFGGPRRLARLERSLALAIRWGLAVPLLPAAPVEGVAPLGRVRLREQGQAYVATRSGAVLLKNRLRGEVGGAGLVLVLDPGLFEVAAALAPVSPFPEFAGLVCGYLV